MLVVEGGASRKWIEKGIVGGGNVDDAEASVLDIPRSQRTVRFGNHRAQTAVNGADSAVKLM